MVWLEYSSLFSFSRRELFHRMRFSMNSTQKSKLKATTSRQALSDDLSRMSRQILSCVLTHHPRCLPSHYHGQSLGFVAYLSTRLGLVVPIHTQFLMMRFTTCELIICAVITVVSKETRHPRKRSSDMSFEVLRAATAEDRIRCTIVQVPLEPNGGVVSGF